MGSALSACERKLGVDFDDVFAYSTVKHVRIRDERVGLLNFSAKVLIVIYIVVYQLMYNCKHMVHGTIEATTRVTIQRPTKDHCDPKVAGCQANFTQLRDLPYCRQWAGPAGLRAPHQKHCQYFDEQMWNFGPEDRDGKFIPTIYQNTTQRRSSSPETNAYTFTDRDIGEASYVADIESFTLLFDHSFTSHDLGLSRKKQDCSGSWVGSGGAAGEPVPVGRSFHGAPAALPSIRTIPGGDIVSLRDLLRLSGAQEALDQEMLQTSCRRNEGGILIVDVTYSNNRRWDFLGSRKGEITYTYRPRLVPSHKYKRMYMQPLPGTSERVIHDFHGLSVVLNVRGDLVGFDEHHLLLVLTTSATLLAASSFFTDLVATRLLAERRKYRLLKIQSSQDFGDHSRRRRLSEMAARESGARKTQEALSEVTSLERVLFQGAVRKAQERKAPAGSDAGGVQFAVLPSEEQLLALLLEHERRLNVLDGRDEELVHLSAPPADRRDRLYEYRKEYLHSFERCILELAQEGAEPDPEAGELSLLHKARASGLLVEAELDEGAGKRREMLMEHLRLAVDDAEGPRGEYAPL